MIKSFQYLLSISCLLLGFLLPKSIYAQGGSCPNLKITKIEILKGAACNEKTNGGVIKITLSDNINLTGVYFYVITKHGASEISKPGEELIIRGIPQDEGLLVSSSVIPCLNGTIPQFEKFDMPFGLHFDETLTFAGQCSANEPAKIITKAVDGTGNYTYTLLKNGVSTGVTSTDGTFNYGVAGEELSVSVKDNGCASAPIKFSNKFTVRDLTSSQKLIQGPSTVCPGEAITLSATLPGTTEHLWKGPDGNQSVQTDANGFSEVTFVAATAGTITYTLQLTTPTGCLYTEDLKVSVASPPNPIIDPIEQCQSSVSGTIALSDFVRVTEPQFSLVWYADAAGNTKLDTPPTVPANVAGTTTYYVAQKGAANCQTYPPAPVTAMINPTPPPISDSKINVFINPSAPIPVITVREPVLGYEYKLYTVETGGSEIGSTGIIGTVAPTKVITGSNVLNLNTTYYLSTISDKACEASTRTPIVIGAASDLIDGPSEVCFGTTLTLNLTSAVTSYSSVEWIFNGATIGTTATLTIANVTAAYSGSYTIRVVTPDGVMEDSQLVTVNQTSKPTVPKLVWNYCKGQQADQLQADAAANHTLKWYKNNAPITNIVPETTTSGTQLFQVSQVNNTTQCESARVDIEVNVHELPAAVPAANLSACIGSKPIVHVANSTPGYEYYLYAVATGGTPEVSATGDGGTIELLGTSSLSQASTFYVEVVNTNTCAAASRTPIKVLVNDGLITGSADVCEGRTITLTAVAVAGAQYTWTRPNGQGTLTGNPLMVLNATTTDAGRYTLNLEQPLCAAVQATFDVNVGRPNMPGGKDVFNFCLNEKAAPLAAEANTNYILRWYEVPFGGTASLFAPTPATNATGTKNYYVTQAPPDDPSCESERRELTVVVHALPNPVHALAPINICAGNIPQIVITGSEVGFNYVLYSVAQGGTVVDQEEGTGGTITLSAQNAVNADIIYFVEVQTVATGCASSSRTAVSITVTDLYLKPEKLPTFKRNEAYSVALLTNASNPVFTYKGDFPSNYFQLNGLTGEISGMVPATGSAEARTFTVQVEDPNGCIVAREYTLKSDLLITQVFSPNGDGINDIFMKGYHVEIFDRKGVKLFDGENGWDGTRNGAVMHPDTYFFILRYMDDDGIEKKATGHIMLLTR